MSSVFVTISKLDGSEILLPEVQHVCRSFQRFSRNLFTRNAHFSFPPDGCEKLGKRVFIRSDGFSFLEWEIWNYTENRKNLHFLVRTAFYLKITFVKSNCFVWNERGKSNESEHAETRGVTNLFSGRIRATICLLLCPSIRKTLFSE